MALLLKLAPDFLKEDRLHWLRAPLFKIEKGKKNYFYFSDKEFNEREVTGGNQYRFKGLGEMSTEDTRQSMFIKETQRLDQLKWTEDSEQLLEDLMGKDVQPRKEFVFNRIDFEKYGEI